MTVAVDEDVYLGGMVSVRRDDFGGAYGVEVTMDNAHRMQILQSVGHSCELHKCFRI